MSKNGFQGLELMEGRREDICEGSARDLATPRGCLPGMDEENGATGAGRMGLAWHGACREQAGRGAGKQGAVGAEARDTEKQALTCCKVKVVRLRRCFLRRNPSSKSPAE